MNNSSAIRETRNFDQFVWTLPPRSLLQHVENVCSEKSTNRPFGSAMRTGTRTLLGYTGQGFTSVHVPTFVDFNPFAYMNRPLTHQQQAVYDFIRRKIIERGYGPTVREIGEHMSIKSPNGVMCHLRALERKGMLTRTANKSRAIELTEPVSRLMGGSLPMEGTIAAGVCTLGATGSKPFDVGELVAAERYVLEVKDDSLAAARLSPGDRLVIQKQLTASPGQLALVRTGEHEMGLRYWQPEEDRIRLRPIDPTQPAVLVAHVQILGIVVGVVRIL